jgi:hypothetical protein
LETTPHQATERGLGSEELLVAFESFAEQSYSPSSL